MKSEALEGVRVVLDRLIYERNWDNLPEDTPHAFIYFLTIQNLSSRTITFLGRKWIIEGENGVVEIVEGDGIVGKTPRLKPGESFSYNSYHATGMDAQCHGAFYGVDEYEQLVHTCIPRFEMSIPEEAKNDAYNGFE